VVIVRAHYCAGRGMSDGDVQVVVIGGGAAGVAAARRLTQAWIRCPRLDPEREGKWSAGDLEAALTARDRDRCVQVAPPHGLYLVRVEY
jgi:cation diffusion facilitator CzcD-associated flavoprotein CzcO